MLKITLLAFILPLLHIFAGQEELISADFGWGTLQPQLFYHDALIHNGWFYTIGGQGKYGRSSILRWKLENGTPISPALPTHNSPFAPDQFVSSPAAVQNGNILYIISGRLGARLEKDTVLKTVWYATINQDGSFRDFQQTSPLPEHAMAGGGTAVMKGHLYYIGGLYTREVFSAIIRKDGSLEEWQAARNLPSNMAVRDGICVIQGRIYVTGAPGHRMGSNKIYFSQPDADGQLKRWMRTTDLPTKGDRAVLLSEENSILYCDGIGGKIYRADIEDRGHLGDWQEIALMPVKQAVDFTMTQLPDGRLFYLGGICLKKPLQFPGNTLIDLKGIEK